MPTRKTVRKAKPKRTAPTAAKTAVQETLEVTWVLKGHLKNAQIAYIRVGALLVQVRDRKLYAALKHPDLESYAEERLQLARASLYRYLQAYDWICQFHKEWLEPKPKGFIPDLADVTDLIWIERELTRKDLEPKMKTALEELQKKALDGRLRKGELDKVRSQGRGTEKGLKSFLSKVRLLRRRGSQLASMPAGAVKCLDEAIEIIENSLAVDGSGL